MSTIDEVRLSIASCDEKITTAVAVIQQQIAEVEEAVSGVRTIVETSVQDLAEEMIGHHMAGVEKLQEALTDFQAGLEKSADFAAAL